MSTFDFDDWSALFIRDPAAFEARRQALLAIELAKRAPAVADPVREALHHLETDIAGLDEAQRLELSMRRMAASVDALSSGVASLARAALRATPRNLH